MSNHFRIVETQMKKHLRLTPILLTLLLPLHAHAYVDPGTGILLWQGLIAAAGVLLFVIRNPKDALKKGWEKITRRNRSKLSDPS